MRVLIASLSLSLLGSGPALAQFDQCDSRTPYTPQWAGFSAQVQAQIDATALSEVGVFLGQVNPESEVLGVELRANLIRQVVGQYKDLAISKVVDHYTCLLVQAYPDRREDIIVAYDTLVDDLIPSALDDSFADLGWAERRAARNELLEAARRQPPTLTTTQVLGTLPDDNFTRRQSFELIASAYYGPATATACAGTLFHSIELLDPRVLGALDRFRTQIARYYSGGRGATGIITLLLGLNVEIARDHSGLASNRQLTVRDLVCLDAIRTDAESKLTDVPTNTSTQTDASDVAPESPRQ